MDSSHRHFTYSFFIVPQRWSLICLFGFPFFALTLFVERWVCWSKWFLFWRNLFEDFVKWFEIFGALFLRDCLEIFLPKMCWFWMRISPPSPLHQIRHFGRLSKFFILDHYTYLSSLTVFKHIHPFRDSHTSVSKELILDTRIRTSTHREIQMDHSGH